MGYLVFGSDNPICAEIFGDPLDANPITEVFKSGDYSNLLSHVTGC